MKSTACKEFYVMFGGYEPRVTHADDAKGALKNALRALGMYNAVPAPSADEPWVVFDEKGNTLMEVSSKAAGIEALKGASVATVEYWVKVDQGSSSSRMPQSIKIRG